ncbi:protein of unknown function (plasmid) [Cupriavidus taiwanensis]|uniref:Transposase n=1 Tax=Cupriavidus taiwanensis TaxID=164546 RepID=A0A375IA32_9BURK|nr:hypothetical protein CT19425_U350045 [Cupriavidus taiwanensis]SPK74881.1 protein of unknown function [Cupriavidus taiwanensis]
MRGNDHGYADEEEAYGGVSGSGPRAAAALPEGLLDELVKGPMTPSEVQDLMLAFNKAIIERAMSAEMSMHLGYKPGEPKPAEQSNARNGLSGKTVITERGPVVYGVRIGGHGARTALACGRTCFQRENRRW